MMMKIMKMSVTLDLMKIIIIIMIMSTMKLIMVMTTIDCDGGDNNVMDECAGDEK